MFRKVRGSLTQAVGSRKDFADLTKRRLLKLSIRRRFKRELTQSMRVVGSIWILKRTVSGAGIDSLCCTTNAVASVEWSLVCQTIVGGINVYLLLLCLPFQTFQTWQIIVISQTDKFVAAVLIFKF